MPDIPGVPTVRISAQTGENLNDLLDAFEQAVWGDSGNGADVAEAVNARHLAHLNDAAAAMAMAIPEILEFNWELAAANLRQALVETGRIVGETVEPDLLEEIFGRFCIGK